MRPTRPGRSPASRTRRARRVVQRAAGLVHRSGARDRVRRQGRRRRGARQSGVFTGAGAPPDYVVSFPKAGSYRYLCTVHPGMKGTVKVLPEARQGALAQARREGGGQAGRRDRRSRRAGWPARRPAATSCGPATTAGRSRSSRSSPARARSRQARPCASRCPPISTELHDVVFGPDELLAQTAAAFISPGAQGIAYDPVSVYASDPGALTHDGANHGNGFLNTGLIDADPRTASRRPSRSRSPGRGPTASSARSTARR